MHVFRIMQNVQVKFVSGIFYVDPYMLLTGVICEIQDESQQAPLSKLSLGIFSPKGSTQ